MFSKIKVQALFNDITLNVIKNEQKKISIDS